MDALLNDVRVRPPMTNGELVFEEPWQGRVFGMARLLAETGRYSWDEFRAYLIEEIGRWEASAAASGSDEGYRYYDRFLAAFQALLKDKGLLDGDDIEVRFSAFAARPHGHDH